MIKFIQEISLEEINFVINTTGIYKEFASITKRCDVNIIGENRRGVPVRVRLFAFHKVCFSF